MFNFVQLYFKVDLIFGNFFLQKWRYYFPLIEPKCPRNTNCTQGMGLSMPALIVFTVRNVIAFRTRRMGPRSTFAKLRTQDSLYLAFRAQMRLYAGHIQDAANSAPIVKSHFFQLLR
jgi:hypothetical protein